MIGNQQFKLQGTLPLGNGHDLPDAAKERIVCDVQCAREPELAGKFTGAGHPVLAKHGDLRRRADADVFAHAECLQAAQALDEFGVLSKQVCLDDSKPADPSSGSVDRGMARQRIKRIASGG